MLARNRSLIGRLAVKYLVRIIILVFALSVPVSSFSSEDTSEDPFKYLSVNVGTWIIKGGEASFQTSFPAVFLAGTGHSKLEWEALDSYAYILGAKVKPYFYFLTFDLQYVGGDIRDGECTDTDWDEGYTPWSVSKNATDGDIKYWSIDLDILLYPYLGRPVSWGIGEKKPGNKTRFEAILGYFHYEYNLHIFNGVQTVPSTGPFSGLDSTYDFEWKGYKTGLRYMYDFVKEPSDGLHAMGFKIEYSYLWGIDFNGEGYWNLRDLRFTQEADDGTGNDWVLGFFYNPLKNLQVQFGHRWLTVSAKNGYDYRDGTINAYLDAVDSKSKGWFFNLAYNF